MIEPERLVIAPNQFDFAGSVSALPGVHIITGPNNSGKTRLLHAIATSSLQATITPSETTQILAHFDNQYARQGGHVAGKIVQCDWARDGLNPTFSSENTPAREALGRTMFSVTPGKVRRRPIKLVVTNRHFVHKADVRRVGSIDDLETFPLFVERLRINIKEQGKYARLQSLFNDVTEGLSFDVMAQDEATQEREIFIKETGEANLLPLKDCGDGLRDLLVVLSNVVCHAEYDLLIDEPGIRLHSRTQRRLVAALNAHAQQNRVAIYITTHDDAIITDPAASSRYILSRNKNRTLVRAITERAEIWDALRALGGEPARVLGVSSIVIPEGPSDTIVFRAAIDVLRASNVSAGDYAVEHLGGDGSIVKSSEQLLEVLRTVIPLGRIVFVLDKTGSSPDRKREPFTKLCESKKISLHTLEKGDLEDYLPNELFERYCRHAVPELADAAISAGAHQTGMARFKKAAEATASNEFTKVKIAQYTAGLPRDEFAKLLSELLTELSRILGFLKTTNTVQA